MDMTVSARIVRDDQQEFVADGNDWILTEIIGAAAPTYEHFAEDNAVGDGVTLTGKRAKARDLQLSARAMLPRHNDLLRAQALAFFTHRHTYRVYLTYMGRTRWLAAELAAFDAPAETLTIPQRISVYFLAPDPYWQSVDDFGQDIAADSARWGWPYMDNPTYHTLASVYNFARAVVFAYDGDVPAAPTITLTADSQVVNPRIAKGDAYIRLLDTLQAGDRVEITTKPPAIAKNGQNVLNLVDRSSDFGGIRLTPGTNIVRFDADYGDNSLHVVLHYNKQYTGV